MPTTVTKTGPVTITVTTPDLSAKGMKGKYRRSVAEALDWHRRSFLPRHFQPEAFTRYAAEYFILREWYAIQAQKARKRGPLGLLPGEGQKKHGIVNTGPKAGRNVGWNRDKANLRPLYQSGRTESSALNTPGVFSGTPEHYALVIRRLPMHLNFVPNVRRMLSAIADDEGAATSRRVEENLSREINK